MNRSLFGAEDSSESWISYLDHIDDKVQDGLFQLLFRSLHFLSENMNPQVHTPGNNCVIRLTLCCTDGVIVRAQQSVCVCV